MSIDFYYMPGSASCRFILLTAKALDINLNLIHIDIKKKSLRTSLFKINPKLTVPTLVDSGLVLLDSKAIVTHLVERYGKDDSLYPKDGKERGLIDRMLHFDMERLRPAFADCYYPTMFRHSSVITQKSLKKAKDLFKYLDLFLEPHKFVTGDDVTVADLALVATVSSFEAMDFEFKEYPNVVRWLNTVKINVPGYEEVNERNILLFKTTIEELLTKLKT